MKKYSVIILISTLALITLGIIMVLSASSEYSYWKFENLFKLFKSHLGKVLLGLFFLITFSIIPYEKLKNYAKPAIIGVVGLLVFTRLFAHSVKGAGRWINLGFINFQPTDAAKVALFVFLAALIEKKGEEISDFKNGFMQIFVWVLVVAGLILIQPNISNGILLILIGLSVLYMGGAQLKHIFGSLFACGIAGLTAAMLFHHSRERIMTYFTSVKTGSGINTQVEQALLGLGSGGLFGVGFGHSWQSKLFLPESYG